VVSASNSPSMAIARNTQNEYYRAKQNENIGIDDLKVMSLNKVNFQQFEQTIGLMPVKSINKKSDTNIKLA